jgi:hypothetical protein
MVDCGNDVPGMSSGFGEVEGGVSLHSQRGLVSMQFDQLGVEGCLLTYKLIMMLSHQELSVDLPSMDLRLLPLLIGLLLDGEELHPWLGAVVYTVTVRMVWSVRVVSSTSVVVMGTVGVTTLHPRGLGDPEPPQHPRRCRPRRKNPQGWCAKTMIHYAPFLQKWHLSPPRREKHSGGQGD